MDTFNNEILTVDVGKRLFELRSERGRSLRSLARSSGLSTNALSMIERGRTSPSVSTLYKISDALGVPITAFFRQEIPQQNFVFRKNIERKRVTIDQTVWEGLGGEAFTGYVEPFVLTLEPGTDSGIYDIIHSGSEFVLCLDGQIEYQVESQRFTLEPGDSLLFVAHLRHYWRNTGSNRASMLVVLSGFEQGERPSEFHLSSGRIESHDP